MRSMVQPPSPPAEVTAGHRSAVLRLRGFSWILESMLALKMPFRVWAEAKPPSRQKLAPRKSTPTSVEAAWMETS